MEKPQNVLRSKTTNRQTPSKLPFEAIGNVFCIKAGTYIKKRKPCFYHYVWQILVDGDFFVRNLDASVRLRQN